MIVRLVFPVLSIFGVIFLCSCGENRKETVQTYLLPSSSWEAVVKSFQIDTFKNDWSLAYLGLMDKSTDKASLEKVLGKFKRDFFQTNQKSQPAFLLYLEYKENIDKAQENTAASWDQQKAKALYWMAFFMHESYLHYAEEGG